MTADQPMGEQLRKAVRWISQCLEDDESASLGLLIQNAGQRYNLSPKDQEFLSTFFAERKTRVS